MKGKLILTDIQSPVEGMQVVWKNTIWNVQVNFDNAGNNRLVHNLGRIRAFPNISELKQIVVEYEERDAYEPLPDTFRLPLHPDDWKWGIEHIGEEVEFEIKKRDIVDNSKCTCKTSEDWKKCEHFTGPPINDCLQIEIVKIDMAKLIHPTPVTYTEEEVLNKLLELAFYSGNLTGNSVRNWWNEHKKK